MTDIILEASGLTKYYRDKLALNHFDFQLKKGSVCALLGRNGSGKSTFIKLALGLLKPTAGSTKILGHNSQDLSPEIRERIGYVTEEHSLPRWMRIDQLQKFQQAYFSKWNSDLFADMLNYFELSPKEKIKNLSNGQRAQVSLALSMAPSPEVLILDDPTLGLDVVIRRQFLEGMIQLIQQQNKTILFSSHILSDVERIADQVVVIDKGILRANCSMEQFRTEIKKIHIEFSDKVPEQVEIPGLLTMKISEKHLELTLAGTNDEQIAAWAQTAKATSYHQLDLNIEDQFIEFTSTRKSRKLFSWEVN